MENFMPASCFKVDITEIIMYGAIDVKKKTEPHCFAGQKFAIVLQRNLYKRIGQML
jgi:hypothetical protein